MNQPWPRDSNETASDQPGAVHTSVDRLIQTLDCEIIEPAETRFNELVLKKAERMTTRRV
jgi:hypothetical protein